MSKNKPVFSETVISIKRQKNKLKRGFGNLAMEKANATFIEWTQKSDPLFKVKGIERYNKAKELIYK
jgi:hypothetical protein